MNQQCTLDPNELAIGMYVSAVDGPWPGKSFPPQGFFIQSERELDALKRLCRRVVVDNRKSAVAVLPTSRSMTPELRGGPDMLEVPEIPETPEAPERAESPATDGTGVQSPPGGGQEPTAELERTEASSQGEIGDERLTNGVRHYRALRQHLEDALAARTRTFSFTRQLFQDERLGHSLDARAAKLLVNSMVSTINDDPTALLWAAQISDHDQHILRHSVNVCVLSMVFASHLGYSDDRLRTIGLGALLHDVGKVSTPRAILNKPGRLTPDEFDIVKRHPADGHAAIIATCNDEVPEEALKIIRHHHERVDGRGYPDGLRGAQIPVPVLIVALADAYDAMTSRRCYRAPIPADQSLATLYRNAGNTFGTDLVSEFIRCIGIYPVGSLVELDTGGLAVVLTNDPDDRLRPTVMMIRDSEGSPCTPRPHLNLAEQANAMHTIRRVVSPEQTGFDLQTILAEEIVKGRSRPA